MTTSDQNSSLDSGTEPHVHAPYGFVINAFGDSVPARNAEEAARGVADAADATNRASSTVGAADVEVLRRWSTQVERLAAGFTDERALLCQQAATLLARIAYTPAVRQPDEDGDVFKVADSDLHELLNLSADLLQGRAGMDTGLLWAKYLKRVEARLVPQQAVQPSAPAPTESELAEQMREKFEEVATMLGFTARSLATGPDGRYILEKSHDAWTVWQEATEFATKVASERAERQLEILRGQNELLRLELDDTRKALARGFATNQATRRDWVDCPVCGETDMCREVDEDDNPLITCTNHNCGSNGGSNWSALAPAPGEDGTASSKN